MKKKLGAWECECGHIEYGTYPPEECKECWKMNSFVKSKDDEDEGYNELEGLI